MNLWAKICNFFKKEEKQEKSLFSRFPHKTKYEEQFDRYWRIFSDQITKEYIDKYKPNLPLSDHVEYNKFMKRMYNEFCWMFWENRKEEIENDKSN